MNSLQTCLSWSMTFLVAIRHIMTSPIPITTSIHAAPLSHFLIMQGLIHVAIQWVALWAVLVVSLVWNEMSLHTISVDIQDGE
jgi:hypothetical protein